MSLRVYNTLSRQKELFVPVRPGKVGMYLCGPTVYKPPHIGHMVGPVIFDAIKRYLKHKGYDVTWVVNITDVDDKLIDAAAKAGTTVAEMAERYTADYMDCLNLLSIDSIDQFPKASEHIGDIVQLCQTLIDAGNAYASEGNVWFDVTRDADYGKLSNRRVEQQEAGLRTLEGAGKRSPADFALWKAAKPGEPAWDSPWGKGRPGWHIECSAMSMKYLGPTLDMHGGGMDLMFPHHENELAQSETATGKTFVRFWLHNGLTKVKTKSASGEWQMSDMHASSGNVISARELIAKHGPELFRYMLLSTHYRRPIDFSDDVLSAASKGMATFTRLFDRIERLRGGALEDSAPDMDAEAARLLETGSATFARAILNDKMRFLEMMDDDFNTAGAIAVLHESASAINAYLEKTRADVEKNPDAVEAASTATQTLRKLGRVLGLFRVGPKPAAKDTGLADQLMELIIKLRNDARKNKNFAIADGIRDGLKALNITLEDRPGGTAWTRS